ncbi:hypothetical protein [Bacteroides faecis]|uniref:hypothetical protein n=1 Tax=Bacteroides faecis TaxID=674529 RepID=UPI00321912D5
MKRIVFVKRHVWFFRIYVAQSGAGGDSGDDPDKGSGGSGSDDDEAPDPTV